MIASLEGIVTEKDEESIVLSLGGLGLKVNVTKATAENAELHKMIGLFTHLVVREDSLTLYGFETQEEKEMFISLLSVSGVGPRTALATLSTASIDTIKRAVVNEQPDLLSHIPGVGKKTAQSIVLHLQGKISGDFHSIKGVESTLDADVISALTSLGYSIVEAQAAMQMIPSNTPADLETRVRIALQYFS